MKKILGGLVLSAFLAAPVMAADMRMPVKAPPLPPPPVLYSWTGCYIGGHVGYAWGKKEVDVLPFDPFQADLDHDADGFVAGGQVGCNLWQSDRWVFGIEGQASWADIDGDVTVTGQTFGWTGFGTKADVIGSLAGRLGYAFGATGQTLLFVKGGAAFIHEHHTATFFGPLTFETDKELRWGWMVGAGFEQALGNNWSFKAEYNYSHFGSKDFDVCFGPGAPDCVSFEVDQHVHLVKVGINYKFGGFGGPVVARY
ncbi:MAG: outer membrane beta-barrel protein [Rhizobiales bacterium]|nr:outer membrane beta-barrel protein [Hyphomicrobiales bacterium]